MTGLIHRSSQGKARQGTAGRGKARQGKEPSAAPTGRRGIERKTMIWITCIIAFCVGHWRGWGAGYETGRRRGYVQGAEDQEYADCRIQEEWQAIMQNVPDGRWN
jgi:hypothetical protein